MVSADELFEICSNQLGDLEFIQSAYRRWMKEHSEKVDSSLQEFILPDNPRPNIQEFHFLIPF
jgi:hypothetical protein